MEGLLVESSTGRESCHTLRLSSAGVSPVGNYSGLAVIGRAPRSMWRLCYSACHQESCSSQSRLTSCTRNVISKIASITIYAVQMVVYMQQQQHDKDGTETQDELSAFIRSTVTIHSLITDRIDKLQPSQQLTLKVILTESIH